MWNVNNPYLSAYGAVPHTPFVAAQLSVALRRGGGTADRGCRRRRQRRIWLAALLPERSALTCLRVRPKGAFRRQTKRLNPAHGDLIHGPGLKQVLSHFMGNIQYFTHDTVPPISSLPLKAL